MNINRIVFIDHYKLTDGFKEGRPKRMKLEPATVAQIAGRAGRFTKNGRVTALYPGVLRHI